MLESLLKGSAPPEGVAQKSAVRKWNAYLMAVAERMKLTERPIKVSKLKLSVNADPLALQQTCKPSPILGSHSLTEGMPAEEILFTDTSAKKGQMVNGNTRLLQHTQTNNRKR